MSEEKKTGEKITINEVAEALGVSPTTVSHAISGKGRVGEGTRRRVLEYAAACGYSPSGNGREAGRFKTHNIAVVIPEVKELVDQPFFYTCMYGVNEVAQANDYDIFVVTTSGKDTRHLERLIDHQKVDGMILARTYKDDVFARYLKEKGLPFVTVGSVDDDEIVQVDHDNRSACRDLTSILLSRKWKKIAYLGNSSGQVVNDDRFAGYVQAHEDAGTAIDWDLVSRENGTAAVMQKKVEEMVEWGADCILCQDDSVCNIVLQELRNENVQIPDDMRVASCHNSKILENYPVSVTTLNFDIMESGRTACRLLLDLIEGRHVEQKTWLDYEVILKESTK